MDATDRTLDGRRDAAITAAAAAIEERLRLYGNDPAAGLIGWGASPRELAALAYDAIAAAPERPEGEQLRSDEMDPREISAPAVSVALPEYQRRGMVSLAERAADVALGNPSRDSSRYLEWIAKPDSPARRAELGHRFEPAVPGYCTCGELVHEGTY